MVDLLESALCEAGKKLKGSTICVLGYAFIENSDDARNTPAVPLLEELKKRGASYRIHDPFVKDDEVYPIDCDIDAALKDCDALVLMTKHDEYKHLGPERLKRLLRTDVIIDGRNLFDAEKFIAAGFVFRGVGKGNIARQKGSELR